MNVESPPPICLPLGDEEDQSLLELLLGPEVGGVTARLLPAVGGPAHTNNPHLKGQ